MQNCGVSDESSDSENSDSEDEEGSTDSIEFPSLRSSNIAFVWLLQWLQMANTEMLANSNGTTQPSKEKEIK